MPAVSGPQYRAMQAAAHGDSTLGIPKSVGKEFVAAGPPKREPEVRPSLEQQMKHRRLRRISRALAGKK